jgi:hypothetical protein
LPGRRHCRWPASSCSCRHVDRVELAGSFVGRGRDDEPKQLVCASYTRERGDGVSNGYRGRVSSPLTHSKLFPEGTKSFSFPDVFGVGISARLSVDRHVSAPRCLSARAARQLIRLLHYNVIAVPYASAPFRPVRLAYQPLASSTFLSQQISHQQSASSTFLSKQTSTSHQPPAKRTGCKRGMHFSRVDCSRFNRDNKKRINRLISCLIFFTRHS